MDRRTFLQSLAAAGVAINSLAIQADAEGGVHSADPAQANGETFGWVEAQHLDTAGHTLLTS